MLFYRCVRFGVAGRVAGATLVAACLALLSGCPVRSLNGLDEGGDNDPNMILDSRLMGTWLDVGENCTSTLTITADGKVYEWQLANCEDNNNKTFYAARLFKLDQHYFLDMTARSEDVCIMCIGIHFICLVQFEKDSLGLACLDDEWLHREVQKKNVNLPTLPDNDDTVTASAKEMKALCRKYADNKEAFEREPGLIFKRQ